MVRLAAWALVLAACSVEGVVLVVPEPTMEAGVLDAAMDAARDAEITLDAQPLLDAQETSIADAQPMPVGVCKIGGASDGFYESFPAGVLDARWLVAEGTQSFAAFKRDNVAIANGDLLLTATAEAGAAIATRDLFASATYQVQVRLSAGVQLAVWWRRDEDADGSIEIASPGADFTHVLMRTRDASGASENQFAVASLNDGSDHILRFDRYTTNSPSVNFWVDDVSRWSTSQHLPSDRAGRMWIVATGTGVVRITNAFITPFGNSGDACRDGELAGPGLVAP